MATSDVFISYRRKDVDFVKHLAQAFSSQGREVWVDWEDIPPGVGDFSREIRMGIEGSNCFVAVLSPDFLESEYCLNELSYAVNLNKRIVPIVLREVDDGVPEAIQTINWVYFVPHAGQPNDFPSAFKALTQAIDTDYDYLREHTRLLTRAQDWVSNERNDSFLISGAELDAAEIWLASATQRRPSAATIHTEFILQSRKAQARRQRRLLSGALVLLALAVIGLVVAVLGGLEARRQQLIAERQADETLSLAVADAAEEYVDAGEYLAGFTLAYYANTFIDDAPQQAQETLRQIAFLPGTRYAFFDDLPADHSFYSDLEPGQSVQSSDQSGTTLVADDADLLRILDADGEAIMRLRRLDRPRGFGSMPDYSEAINQKVLDTYNQAGYYNVPIVLSPDGQFAAAGGEGGLKIVHNNNEAGAYQTLREHTQVIDSLYWSQDGRYLISRASTDLLANTAFVDKEFFVWDTSKWETIFRLDSFERDRDLYAVSEDGLHLLFVEARPPGYTLWDVRDSRLLHRDQPIAGPVMEVAFAPDGESYVVTSVLSLTARPARDFAVYDLAGSPITHFGGPDSGNVIDLPLLFTPDGAALRVINKDGSLGQTDLLSGESSTGGTLPYTGVEGHSASGQYIALKDYDQGQYVIWDLEAGAEVARFDDEDVGFSMTLSNDGRWLSYSTYTDTGNPELVIRDLGAGTEAARFDDFAGSSDYIGAIAFAFSADSESLLYADIQGNLRRVQTGSWEEQRLLRGVPGTISDMKLSQDQGLVAAAGERGTVVVWDAATGSVLQRIEGAGAVAKLSINPDSSLLLIGDEQGYISLWQLTAFDDVLGWIQANRALVPLTCADLLQARVIASADSCPLT